MLPPVSLHLRSGLFETIHAVVSMHLDEPTIQRAQMAWAGNHQHPIRSRAVHLPDVLGTIASNRRCSSNSSERAASPSLTVSTVYPSASRLNLNPSARCFSSSTTGTAFISSSRKLNCKYAAFSQSGALCKDLSTMFLDY